MNKLKFHIWSQWGALGLVMLLAVGLIAVKAYENYSLSQPASVIEHAENVTINQAVAPPVQEESLGAISDATNLPRMMCTGGECTATFSGDLADATTTILWFASPFTRATSTASDVVIDGTTNNGYGLTAATSTVDMVRVEVTTTATSTYSVDCGSAAYNGRNGASTPSVELLSTATNSIATSSTGVLENNLTAALGGLVDGSTVEKITLNQQYPYFTCLVTSLYTGAFTEVTNTFDGQYTVTIRNAR